MRIVICDDDARQVEALTALLAEWGRGSGLKTFDSAESFLFAYEDDKAVDILLLDIQMPGMDGVALAKAVRSADRAVQIVFITGYTDYILDGYDVEALNYLLKPVSREKLFAVLDKAAEKLAFNEKALVVDGVRVPLFEVRYLEVMRNYVTVHAVGGEYSVKKPLKEFEDVLDRNFFRVGRSYIVNLRYVRRTNRREVVMSCGAVVPLPRGGYGAINRAMIEVM